MSLWPLRTLEPWVRWILPNLHGFCKWVVDMFVSLLYDSVSQVAVSRRDVERVFEISASCFHFGHIFVPPSPFRVKKDKEAQTSRILMEPDLVGCLMSVGLDTFVVTVGHFLRFVDPFLPQEPVLDLPRITGQDLFEMAEATKSSACGLDGWTWKEILALLLAWFSGLAVLLNMV